MVRENKEQQKTGGMHPPGMAFLEPAVPQELSNVLGHRIRNGWPLVSVWKASNVVSEL